MSKCRGAIDSAMLRAARQTADVAAEMQATLQLDAPRLAMRFSQLMCQGYNTDTQTYLKDQEYPVQKTLPKKEQFRYFSRALLLLTLNLY